MEVVPLKSTFNPRKPGYVDLYRQQRIYEITSGDQASFIGFERRLAEWSDKNRLTRLSRAA
jgi:hypothetical protein